MTVRSDVSLCEGFQKWKEDMMLEGSTCVCVSIDHLSQEEVFCFFAVDGSSVWDVWLRTEVQAGRGGEDGDGHQGDGEKMRRHAGEVRLGTIVQMFETNLTARALWRSLRKV